MSVRSNLVRCKSGKRDSQLCMDSELYNANLLVRAIYDENLSYVKWLFLEKKANPNVVLQEQGISAMHLLAGMENEYFTIEILHLALTDCDGDPNVRSVDGLTPVHLSVMWGRCKALELLLNFGGNPDLTEYKSGLNAENLALREHQWNAYAVIATFIIMRDDDCGNVYFSRLGKKENILEGESRLNSIHLDSPKHTGKFDTKFAGVDLLFSTGDDSCSIKFSENIEYTKATQTTTSEIDLHYNNTNQPENTDYGKGTENFSNNEECNKSKITSSFSKIKANTKHFSKVSLNKFSFWFRSIFMKAKLS